MSSNQTKQTNVSTFRLEFYVQGSLSEFVKLQLFDGYGNLIEDTYGYIACTLAKGLYKIHIFSNETFVQRFVILDKDTRQTWENKGSFSSISDTFLKSSRNYYLEASRTWRKRYTVDPQPVLPQDTSLFLFFRYPSSEKKIKETRVADSMGWRFSIVNSDRKIVYQLNENQIMEDKVTGWLAFHAKLPPGLYYLVYRGAKQREIPLHIFPTWQTQLFLTFKRTPIFETARIQILKHGDDHYESDEDNLQLDTLLRNIHNGNYFLPENIIMKAAHDKWHNPMLAIAVCYAYLLSKQNAHDRLFKIIVENLQNRILSYYESPDLKVIRLLAAIHFKKEIPDITLSEPCMLNIGMKTVLTENIRFPERVKITGLCEQILTDLKNDIVWTSYFPAKEKEKETDNESYNKIEVIGDFNVDGLILWDEDVEGDNDNENTLNPDNQFTMPRDWLSQSIIDQLAANTKKTYSIKELANQFQVTRPILSKSLQLIKDFLLINSDNDHFLDDDLTAEKMIVLQHNIESLRDDDISYRY